MDQEKGLGIKTMVPTQLTAEQYRQALQWYVEHCDKPNIFLGEKSIQLFGYLGEAAFLAMRPDSIRVDQKGHDFISNGLRVEVKTTTNPYPPMPNFEMCMSKVEAPETWDAIACFYVDTKAFDIYYLGYLYPQDLVGKFRPEGFEIPGGKKLRSACYRIPFAELR